MNSTKKKLVDLLTRFSLIIMRPIHLVSALSLFAATLNADYKDDIGFTALQALLGDAMLTGAGVKAGLVEANSSTLPEYAYMPSATPGDVLTNESNLGNAISWHATTVAGFFFGENSIAPQVGNTVGGTVYPVTVYEANHWVDSRLRFGKMAAPVVEVSDVVNLSWVGDYGEAAYNASLMRRLDFSIQRDDFVAVVGVDNQVDSTKPLLSNAYNTINVGVSSGSHQSNQVAGYGTNKQRVHLVAPQSATSYATATVSGAAALLIEGGRQLNAGATLENTTVKALLMTGATKHQLAEHTYERYGAGQLNVLNSYEILAAGKQSVKTQATELSENLGYNVANLASSSSHEYRVYADDASEISVTLAWNALFNAPSNYENLSVNLHNLDLKVYFSEVNTADNGALLLTNTSSSSGTSTTDNVEHLWWGNRNAGYYTFMVQNLSSDAQGYSIAWSVVPEPSKLMLFLMGGSWMILKRRRNA